GPRAVGVEVGDLDRAPAEQLAVLLPPHLDALLRAAVDHAEAHVDLPVRGERKLLRLAATALALVRVADPNFVDVDPRRPDRADRRLVVDADRQALEHAGDRRRRARRDRARAGG